jgi:Mor family transcriptional regulator
MTDEKAEKSAYPEILADLADQVAVKIAELGVAPERAAEIGAHVAEHIRVHWSGSSQYIPKGTGWELSQRDRQIWAEFNGRNHAALARKHGLTEMRIYQIIKAVRAAAVKQSQGALF